MDDYEIAETVEALQTEIDELKKEIKRQEKKYNQMLYELTAKLPT